MARPGAAAADPLNPLGLLDRVGVRPYNNLHYDLGSAKGNTGQDFALANTAAVPFFAEIKGKKYYFHSLEHFFQVIGKLEYGHPATTAATVNKEACLRARELGDESNPSLTADSVAALRGVKANDKVNGSPGNDAIGDTGYAQAFGNGSHFQNTAFHNRLKGDGTTADHKYFSNLSQRSDPTALAEREGAITQNQKLLPYKIMVIGMMMKLSQTPDLYTSLKASIDAESTGGGVENPDLFIEHALSQKNTVPRDTYWGYPGLNLQGRALKDAMRRLIELRGENKEGQGWDGVVGIKAGSDLEGALNNSTQPLPDNLQEIGLVTLPNFHADTLLSDLKLDYFQDAVGARPSEVDNFGQLLRDKRDNSLKLAAISPAPLAKRKPAPLIAPPAGEGRRAPIPTPAKAATTQKKPAPSEEKRMRELAKEITNAASLTEEQRQKRLKELLLKEEDAKDFGNLLRYLGEASQMSDDEVQKMLGLLGLTIKSASGVTPIVPNSIAWVPSLPSSAGVDDKRRYLAQRVMMNVIGQRVKANVESDPVTFMRDHDPKNLLTKDNADFADFYLLARFEEYKAAKPHLKDVSYEEFVGLVEKLVGHDLTPKNREKRIRELQEILDTVDASDTRKVDAINRRITELNGDDAAIDNLKRQRLLESFTESSAVDGKMSGSYAELASLMLRENRGGKSVNTLLNSNDADLSATIEAARKAQLAKAQTVGIGFLARQEFASNKRLFAKGKGRRFEKGEVTWKTNLEAEAIDNEQPIDLKKIKNSPDLKEDGIRNSPYFNQASIPQVVGDQVKEHSALGIVNIFQGDEGLSSLTTQVAEACEVERKPDDRPLVSLAFLEGIMRDGKEEKKCAIITQTKRGTTTTFVDPEVFQNSILPEYKENYRSVLSHISTVESVREISDILIVAGREIVNKEVQRFQEAIDEEAKAIREGFDKTTVVSRFPKDSQPDKKTIDGYVESAIQRQIKERTAELQALKENAEQALLQPYKKLSRNLAKLIEGAGFKADDTIEQKVAKMRALQGKNPELNEAISEVKKFLEESKQEEVQEKKEGKVPLKVPLLKGDRERLAQLIEIFNGNAATKGQKQKAREESSHQMRHLMAARVEQSIEDAHFRYSLNSNEEAEIHAQFLARDKKFDAKKGLGKLLEAPLPHSPIPDSTSILHPAGHPKTATVTFNGKGDNTAYVYLNGSPSCYLRARRCDSNGKIMVWRDGVQVLEDHKIGDVVIDSGVVFHKKRDGSFCPLSTVNPRLSTSELTEIFGKNVGDEVRKMHDEYNVKAVSLVNGDARSVAVLHQGHSAATELSAKASPYRPTQTTPQFVVADSLVQIKLDKDEPIYDEKTSLFVGDVNPLRLLRLQELDAKTKTKIAVGLIATNNGVHIRRDEAVIMQDGEVLGGLSLKNKDESMDLLRRLYPGKDDEFIERKFDSILKIVDESAVSYRVRDKNGEERYETDSPAKEILARGKVVGSPAEPPSTSVKATSCNRLPEVLQRARE